MSEPKLTQDTADPPDRPRKASFLRRKLPYVAVLTLAIVGVAFTNMSHQPISGFWEFLAVAIGVVCVVTAWPNVARQESSLSADVDASTPLGDFFGHHEHHAIARRSKDGACACKQPGAFDVACTRHFSCWNQSPILGNLLSRPRHGTFCAGDRLAQTVRTLFALGRCPSRRAWHHLLATPGQKLHRVIARERRIVRPVSRASGDQMRQAGSCAHLLYPLPVSARSSPS